MFTQLIRQDSGRDSDTGCPVILATLYSVHPPPEEKMRSRAKQSQARPGDTEVPEEANSEVPLVHP